MSSNTKTFLGIPLHKGDISAPTMMAVVQSGHGVNPVQFQQLGLSLLAKNFAILFCNAYKKHYDYFLLLHSDIGIGPVANYSNWVDLMIRRIQDLEAAVISCVVPIKSPAGHTSTALILEEGNPYNMRRLTVRELLKLPFDSIAREDLCTCFGRDPKKAGAMLINTGVMLMDLRKFDWTQWDGFGIEDKIAWSKNGVPESYTVPEDWRLSNFLYDKGWPYYAIRDIPINHFGAANFVNNEVWGEERDTLCGQCSPEEWQEKVI